MNSKFICPICKKEVEIGEFNILSQSSDKYEYRLGNKRYHMKLHKIIKKKQLQIEKFKNKLDKLNKELIIEIASLNNW